MENKIAKKIIRFVPAILWMIIIFHFSSRPTVDLGGTITTSFFIYKGFHLTEYAILACALFFAVKEFKYTIIIAYLYAMSDELHQTFVAGRTGCIRDTLIDLLGIIIGIFVITLIKKSKPLSRLLF